MQFQSYYYALLFLPTIFFTYNLLKKNNLKNILLIIASYYFYSWGNPLLAILLFSSSIVDFFIGKKVSFFQLMDIITKPSNVLNKITIVEGWTQYDLQNELSKHFESFS